MTATLENILDSVQSGLRTVDDWGTAHATSDGITSRFHLPDYPIIDIDQMAVLVEDDLGVLVLVQATDYEVEAETGWFTFDTPPTRKPDDEERQIQWTWRFRIFSDGELISLINSAVRYVGREYYIEGAVDTSIVTELMEYEYAAPVAAKRLVFVELRPDSSHRWRATNKWKTRNLLGQLYVQFTLHPGLQEVRLSYIAKVDSFSLTDIPAHPPAPGVALLDQTLTSLGLPEEAFDPIMHYACWQAFERRVIRRSRDDAAQHAQAESTVTMRDLESRATRMKLLFDLHYAQFVTDYAPGRIVE